MTVTVVERRASGSKYSQGTLHLRLEVMAGLTFVNIKVK